MQVRNYTIVLVTYYLPLQISMGREQKHRILAFMLLGAFLISFLHSIPHTHHTHSDSEHNISTVDHHHSHNHHQHDSKDDEHSGLLHWLSHHSHTTAHFHDVYVFVSKHKVADNGKVIQAYLSNDGFSTLECFTHSVRNYAAHKDRQYQNPFLTYTSLRGPPSLG